MDKMTVVQGDGGLPDKGTGTAVMDAYGADIGADATNKSKGISGMTQSDPMDATSGIDQKWGNMGSGSMGSGGRGKNISSMTQSDAPEEDEGIDQNWGNARSVNQGETD